MYVFGVRPRLKVPEFPEWSHTEMMASKEAMSAFAEKCCPACHRRVDRSPAADD
jgi:hypothetical protein